MATAMSVRYSGKMAAAGAEKSGEERASSRRLLKGARGGNISRLSEAYILKTTPNCLRLFWQLLRRADSRARARAGRRMAARIPMMAITTSSSMRVNPKGFFAGDFMMGYTPLLDLLLGLRGGRRANFNKNSYSGKYGVAAILAHLPYRIAGGKSRVLVVEHGKADFAKSCGCERKLVGSVGSDRSCVR